MKLSRRDFLGGGAMFAATAFAGGCRSLFTGSAGDYDDSLTVLLSDVHIGSSSVAPKYQPIKFEPIVAEILRMDPLPRRVVVFGDIAWRAGIKGDYVASRPFFQQMIDAGIQVTLGMGNHDRRPSFLEVWPEYATSSPVPGRIVSVVPLGDADLVLLDSLKSEGGGVVEESGYGEGLLSDAQQEWLADWMAKAKRPFFLGAHHPEYEPPSHSLTVKGTRIDRFMLKFPLAAGYIHGHNHSWRASLECLKWQPDGQLPVMGLPSASYWGDIGYVTLRTSPEGAVATLHQKEHFFPRWTGAVAANPAARPVAWAARTRNNDGQTCMFAFPRARPWSNGPRDFKLETSK